MRKVRKETNYEWIFKLLRMPHRVNNYSCLRMFSERQRHELPISNAKRIRHFLFRNHVVLQFPFLDIVETLVFPFQGTLPPCLKKEKNRMGCPACSFRGKNSNYVIDRQRERQPIICGLWKRYGWSRWSHGSGNRRKWRHFFRFRRIKKRSNNNL